MSVNGGPEIVVVGEALVDVVEADGTTREHVGGSPANVALGLGRRGLRVALLTQLGDDRRGKMIADHLRESGVLVLPQSDVLKMISSAIARIAADPFPALPSAAARRSL
ncbi:PfkB family carbohydrate kinase [Microbacterium marinum]|uniref:PfkB family carbohydrate kinase n=1 Tax=Microbacterium marinum TaxID=421115 RepID=UPI00384F6D7C